MNSPITASAAHTANPTPLHDSKSPEKVPFFQKVSTWWRVLAIVLALVLLLGWAAGASMTEQLKAQVKHLQARLVEVPQVNAVAVLLDAQGQPALLATFSANGKSLLIQRLNEVREGREDSMQVWAIGDAATAPISLGVITSKYKTLELPVGAEVLQGVKEIAVSAENKGGVPAGAGPSLPYLFKGWWVQKSI